MIISDAGDYVGIDYSEALVDLARQAVPQAHFIAGDMVANFRPGASKRRRDPFLGPIGRGREADCLDGSQWP